MNCFTEDLSLADQLELILNRRRSSLFSPEVRSEANNYALGLLLLRKMNVSAVLSPKGPFANHYLIWEGSGEGPKDIAEYCRECFEQADVPLKVFFCGLWNGTPRSTLGKYALFLIKRESSLNKNKAFQDELIRLKIKIKQLEASQK